MLAPPSDSWRIPCARISSSSAPRDRGGRDRRGRRHPALGLDRHGTARRALRGDVPRVHRRAARGGRELVHGRAAPVHDRLGGRAGRRGDHDAADVLRDRQRHRPRGRDAGVRRRRSATGTSTPTPSSGRSRRAPGRSCPCTSPDARARWTRSRRSRAATGCLLIEDAAHAIEARCRGRKIGTIGDFTCFSFYVTKNVTTGEGGMVTTADGDPRRAAQGAWPARHEQGRLEALLRQPATGTTRYVAAGLQVQHDGPAGRARAAPASPRLAAGTGAATARSGERYDEAFADLARRPAGPRRAPASGPRSSPLHDPGRPTDVGMTRDECSTS